MRKLTFFVLMLLLSVSCVGTVTDAEEVLVKATDAPESSLEFAGIVSANAISDSRIEVFFYPATGGSGKYVYDIMVGSSPNPISVPSDILLPDYRGLLKYTITGLERINSYQVGVEVREEGSTLRSKSGVLKTSTTFDNQVADFYGISSAYNTPGQDGKDSIKIRFTPARSSATNPKPGWQPTGYEVVVIEAERLSPGDMDLPLTPAQGKFVFNFNHDDGVNEYIVRGLPPRTKFFVRMRAIHKASENNIYNPRLKSELNTNYVSISTLSDSLADINFQADSFAVKLAPGEQGLYAVATSWTAAVGVFDHFRLYYGAKGLLSMGELPELCLSPMQSPPGAQIFCKKVDFSQTTGFITGLEPYTDYDVQLILCATTRCEPLERRPGPIRDIATNPLAPAFRGIQKIAIANSLEQMGSIRINFERPDFTNGYFDGLILKMRRTVDGSDSAVPITRDSTPVSHRTYNFLTDGTIIVDGIDYLATEPYCFTLYSYKNTTEYPNDVWHCISPRPEPPTADQFAGLTSGSSTGDRVTLFWQPPLGGIFSSFEIYQINSVNGSLSWGDATQAADNFDDSVYTVHTVEDTTLSEFTIGNLAPGQYSFGIMSRFTYLTSEGPITTRSEVNNGILRCVVDTSLETGTVVDCAR